MPGQRWRCQGRDVGAEAGLGVLGGDVGAGAGLKVPGKGCGYREKGERAAGAGAEPGAEPGPADGRVFLPPPPPPGPPRGRWLCPPPRPLKTPRRRRPAAQSPAAVPVPTAAGGEAR